MARRLVSGTALLGVVLLAGCARGAERTEQVRGSPAVAREPKGSTVAPRNWSASDPLAIDYAEALPRVVACIQDQGLDAQIEESNSWSVDHGGRTSDELMEIVNACEAEVEADGYLLNPPQTPDVLAATYASFVELRECLIGEGFVLPEMVSLEVYLAGMAQPDSFPPDAMVNPMSSVDRIYGAEGWTKAEAACS